MDNHFLALLIVISCDLLCLLYRLFRCSVADLCPVHSPHEFRFDHRGTIPTDWGPAGHRVSFARFAIKPQLLIKNQGVL